MLIVELKNLSKAYSTQTVLNNINLQVNLGEILALLGPNGSGKSTVLKILAFLENPTSGEVHFQGTKVEKSNYEKLRMDSTIVFQKTTLFNTSVFENVAYGLKIRKIPKEKQTGLVKEALGIVKLDDFERRNAKKLSGGEQQRVAIARALVLKTKLLLLDEPTANLDPKNAAIIEEAIERVNRERKVTIVMATHNMFQAQTLPHRIALMAEGKITEIGAPTEIFSKLSKNLASFAAVENTFSGKAKLTAEGTTIVDLGNDVHVEIAEQKQGETAIFVNPQDIIICAESIHSSARNVFKGKITEITGSGSIVKLKVDVGRVFSVQITKRSFNEMKLNLGSEVCIVFKASSVSVL